MLELDGKTIGDSTAIIATLEDLKPDPTALPPGSADERQRALELEDYFDEELGRYARILAISHRVAKRTLFLRPSSPDMSGASGLPPPVQSLSAH